MPTFNDLTTWKKENGVATLELDESWAQGRAVYGGVVAAAAVALMRHDLPPGESERPLRNVSTIFIGPCKVGTATGQATVLRSGRSTTIAEAVLVQKEAPCAKVIAVFAESRPSRIQLLGRQLETSALAKSPAPHDLPQIPNIPGVTPRFLEHFDLRWASGDMPFSGGENSTFAGWCRHRTKATQGAEALLGLIDAWPPTAACLARGPVPMSSVTWTAHILDEPTTPVDGFYGFERQMLTAGEGYSTQLSQLFHPEGHLVAWSEQLVSVFDQP